MKTVLAATALALGALAVPSPAASMSLSTASICGSSAHLYTFTGTISLKQGSTVFPAGTVVKAEWSHSAKVATENITISPAAGQTSKTTIHAQRTCSSDPWITKASCSTAKITSASGPYKDLVTLGTTGLVPYGVVPSPLTAQQLPQPQITSPKPNQSFVTASVPLAAKAPIPSTPYCTYLHVALTHDTYTGQMNLPIEGGSVTHAIPFDQVGQAGYLGQWTLSAYVQSWTGSAWVTGPAVWPMVFTVGKAGTPLLTASMIKVQSPGTGATIAAKGGFLTVLVEKPLHEQASPKQVAVGWEAYAGGVWGGPWAGSTSLPTQLAFGGASQQWVPASAMLDFGNVSAKTWRVTACVKTATLEKVCQVSEFKLAPAATSASSAQSSGGAMMQATPGPPPPGAGGKSGAGQTSPWHAVPPSPPISGPAVAPPQSGPPPPQVAARREPPRLVSAQQQRTALALVIQNPPGNAELDAQPIVLRLGRDIVGRGQLRRLAAGRDDRVLVELTLPASVRDATDVEIWIGDRRVGTARVTPAARR